jgi:hypothetical protein
MNMKIDLNRNMGREMDMDIHKFRYRTLVNKLIKYPTQCRTLPYSVLLGWFQYQARSHIVQHGYGTKCPPKGGHHDKVFPGVEEYLPLKKRYPSRRERIIIMRVGIGYFHFKQLLSVPLLKDGEM